MVIQTICNIYKQKTKLSAVLLLNCCLFIVANLTLVEQIFALDLTLERGSSTWGFVSKRNLISQKSDNTPLCLTVEIELYESPQYKRPALPWQSWLGLTLEDKNNHYTLGLINPADESAATIKWGLVAYEKRDHIRYYYSDTPHQLETGKFLLRTIYTGQEIHLYWARNVVQPVFELLYRHAVGADFKLSQVGLSVNSAQERSRLDKISFRNFVVDTDVANASDTIDISDATEVNTPRSHHLQDLTGWQVTLPNASVKDLPAPGFVQTQITVLPEVTVSSDMSTATIQELLKPGQKLTFLPGQYQLGQLEIPSYCSLLFAPGAVIMVGSTTQFILAGDDISLDNAFFVLPWGGHDDSPLIIAEKRNNLRFSRLQTSRYNKKLTQVSYDLIRLTGCSDIILTDSQVGGVRNVLTARWCQRVIVCNNRVTDSRALTEFGLGAESLQHYGNWSSNVTYQCVWWGGDSNDNKKNIPDKTARLAERGLSQDDENFTHNAGVYDILVANNIAEYGVTLAWGSKGRNIVINGNLARFMGDLAYDSEGGENVTISNNISINSTAAGIGCYFYGERLLISNNQIFTLNEGEDKYKGGFIRLHSPGRSGHFGNGEVLITGNQMVNTSGKTCWLAIEAARNVVINGNTFRNGGVNITWAADDTVLTNNTFTHYGEELTKTPESIIKIAGKQRNCQISGNNFRYFANSNVVAAVMASHNKEKISSSNNNNIVKAEDGASLTDNPHLAEFPVILANCEQSRLLIHNNSYFNYRLTEKIKANNFIVRSGEVNNPALSGEE